jgi:pimeloyl-ACP methyl ester carboxylesterase
MITGGDLEVERLGEGPAVLFVHGDIVGPASTWRKQRGLAERWNLVVPSRPGFGTSPPLERNDFELEAPLFAELLGEGAHLVGHSYGAVIALIAAAHRPDAVRSLTVSEPGCLAVARGVPAVAEMISDGDRLFGEGTMLDDELFLRLFRSGAGSAYETPEELPPSFVTASSSSSASGPRGRRRSRSTASPRRTSRCSSSQVTIRRRSRPSATPSRTGSVPSAP